MVTIRQIYGTIVNDEIIKAGCRIEMKLETHNGSSLLIAGVEGIPLVVVEESAGCSLKKQEKL